jgi:hypothetical protein
MGSTKSGEMKSDSISSAQDERTDAQKEQDVTKGVVEAYELLNDKTITIDKVRGRLRPITTKYRMTSLEIVIDAEDATQKTIHFEGQINPRRKGDRRAIAGSKKRGDHVFANALEQIITELREHVATQLGASSEANRLLSAFASCQGIMSGSVYQLTVDKGESPVASDVHSVKFGQAAGLFKYAMFSYISALKIRSKSGASTIEQDHRAVVQAALTIELYIHGFINSAVDPDAEAAMPDRQAEIAVGKAGLQQVKALILGAINLPMSD